MQSRPVQVAPRKALALKARGKVRCTRLKAVAGTRGLIMGTQLRRRDARSEAREHHEKRGA
jgi:hypothetical protein